ncbi:MAG: type II secretion system protein GspG [Planctomycetes bacterium]|nr:type II secretion system protein GspG [Planctomycetota bacterium]
MNAKKMLRKARRGFTLIELMVVIVILGVLGTAGFFVFRGAIGESEVARCASEISSMAQGVSSYRTLNRKFPPDGDAAYETLKKMAESDFNKQDPWGTDYQFRFLGEDEGYEIRSFGADKADGTADDVYWRSSENKVIRPDAASGGSGGGSDI